MIFVQEGQIVTIISETSSAARDEKCAEKKAEGKKAEEDKEPEGNMSQNKLENDIERTSSTARYRTCESFIGID